MIRKITFKNVGKVVMKTCGCAANTKEFLAGCILLANAVVGPFVTHVCKFLEIEKTKEVRQIVQNLRKNKIWTRKSVHNSEWFDKKAGGVAFNLDVACALGYLKRA